MPGRAIIDEGVGGRKTEKGAKKVSSDVEQLIRELTKLRKGRGITAASLAASPGVVRALGVVSIAELTKTIRGLGTDDKVRSLLVAFNLIPGLASKLTYRREDLALQVGRNSDTIEAWENEMISNLAHYLVLRPNDAFHWTSDCPGIEALDHFRQWVVEKAIELKPNEEPGEFKRRSDVNFDSVQALKTKLLFEIESEELRAAFQNYSDGLTACLQELAEWGCMSARTIALVEMATKVDNLLSRLQPEER